MFRIAWATDLHLDFAEHAAVSHFLECLRDAAADAVFLGGDLGEATNVVGYLEELDGTLAVPLYVVLGNHDFYRGSIQSVRTAVRQLSEWSRHLHFLTDASEPVALTERIGLVGHDGWADAREGDYHRSLVMMNDYLLIEELAAATKVQRQTLLHRLGDEAATFIRSQLGKALATFEHVFLLTHVPPFRQACWYEGRISDDEWTPHFVCQAMGRAILDLAALHPESQITVLCGHTHHGGECHPAANVHVITGAAEYGTPRITQIFELA